RIFLVTIGSFTYAYASSIIGTTLAQPSFIEYFDMDKRSNAADISGAINGVFQAGGFFGALACILIADKFGRRIAIFIASMLATLGGALQAGSVHIAMYLAMRVVSGLGVGALITMVPLYLAEVAAPEVRGRVVGTTGIMIGVGYSSASWMGFAFYFVNASNKQWRIPIALQCVPALVLAIGVWWLPESPRWLLLNDRADEAHRIFYQAQPAHNTHEVADNSEFELLQRQIMQEKTYPTAFSDLFTNPGMRKRTLLGFLSLFGSQAAGTQVINNYGSSLYAGLGYNTTNTLLIQSCWITTIIFGNVINTVALDKFGRKPLFVLGFAGCAASLIGESVSVAHYQSTASHSAAVAAVFFLFLEVAVFSSTIDATSYVYPSEIFPTPLRAKGMAVSAAGLFLASLIILIPAPTAFENIQWRYYIVFTILSSVMANMGYKTKQKSLEEISALFGQYTPQTTDVEKDNKGSITMVEDCNHG
ncbi:unnamed protein product, partial [Clonostachys byssicola]